MKFLGLDPIAWAAIGVLLVLVLAVIVIKRKWPGEKPRGDDWGGPLDLSEMDRQLATLDRQVELAAVWLVAVQRRSERQARWAASLEREERRADAEFAAAFPNWRYA